MNKNKISITDFIFEFKGKGRYRVKYTSPITKGSWVCETTDMTLIDNTRNSCYPKAKDLNTLKKLCKNMHL